MAFIEPIAEGVITHGYEAVSNYLENRRFKKGKKKFKKKEPESEKIETNKFPDFYSYLQHDKRYSVIRNELIDKNYVETPYWFIDMNNHPYIRMIWKHGLSELDKLIKKDPFTHAVIVFYKKIIKEPPIEVKVQYQTIKGILEERYLLYNQGKKPLDITDLHVKYYNSDSYHYSYQIHTPFGSKLKEPMNEYYILLAQKIKDYKNQLKNKRKVNNGKKYIYGLRELRDRVGGYGSSIDRVGTGIKDKFIAKYKKIKSKYTKREIIDDLKDELDEYMVRPMRHFHPETIDLNSSIFPNQSDYYNSNIDKKIKKIYLKEIKELQKVERQMAKYKHQYKVYFKYWAIVMDELKKERENKLPKI